MMCWNWRRAPSSRPRSTPRPTAAQSLRRRAPTCAAPLLKWKFADENTVDFRLTRRDLESAVEGAPAGGALWRTRCAGLATGQGTGRELRMSATNMLLNVNGIEVIYNHVILVLKGVSLNVPEGKIAAVLGGNGAAKTTTLEGCADLMRQSFAQDGPFVIGFSNASISNSWRVGMLHSIQQAAADNADQIKQLIITDANDDPAKQGARISGLPVLGPLSAIADKAVRALCTTLYAQR